MMELAISILLQRISGNPILIIKMLDGESYYVWIFRYTSPCRQSKQTQKLVPLVATVRFFEGLPHCLWGGLTSVYLFLKLSNSFGVFS